ncbi:MAG: ParA family protein [Planctomycetota bacterium]|jgi:chromosome partitioning protein
MIRTVVINQKGGVGKTTTAVNLGAALARRGKRVLLLDMDPQANLSLHLDQRPDLETQTITSLLVDGVALADLIVKSGLDNLYLVPADTSLSGVEQVLANRIGRETILREAFEDYEGPLEFDHVLMDCPPSLGVISANALVAGHDVIVPMQAEYFAMQGMAKLMEVMHLVQRRLNPALKPSFILPCMVDHRTRLTSEVLAEIRRHFGEILATSCIRSNVKLAEAPSFGHTIFEHAPDSNGARDYLSFAEEFLALHEPVPTEAEEAAHDATVEVVDRAVGETADKVVDEVVDGAADKTADEVSDAIVDEIVDGATDKTADEVSDEIVDGATDKTADEVSDAIVDEATDKTTDKVVDAVVDEIADEIVNEVADRVARQETEPEQESPEKAGEKTAPPAPEGAAEAAEH